MNRILRNGLRASVAALAVAAIYASALPVGAAETGAGAAQPAWYGAWPTPGHQGGTGAGAMASAQPDWYGAWPTPGHQGTAAMAGGESAQPDWYGAWPTPGNLGRMGPDAVAQGGSAQPEWYGAWPTPGAASGAMESAHERRLNLNMATAAELESLPGVGPDLALAIVNYRYANGMYVTIDELRYVNGMSDEEFAAIRDLVTVERE